MDLRRVRYFLALVETLDFSRAARALSITQPALTKAMNRLEQETGGRLIRREGRHTHLTPLGEAMLARFVEVDRVAREAEDTARRLTSGIGSRLRVGVVPTIGPVRLTALVERFRASHPGTLVSLHDVEERELHETLLGGRLDCAFSVSTEADEPRLHRIHLYDEPRVLVLPRASGAVAAGRARVPDAGAWACIERGDGDVRDAVAELVGRDRDAVPVALVSERDDWTQALVGAGLGVSVMPRDSVVSEGVRARSLGADVPPRAVSLAVPSGREDNPVIRGFVELARRFGAEAAAGEGAGGLRDGRAPASGGPS